MICSIPITTELCISMKTIAATPSIAYICIAVILLLIVFSAPASASGFNSTITPTWVGSAGDTQSIQIDQTHLLSYEIRVQEPDLAGNFIFRVVLEHNDSISTEPQTGFRITGHTTAASFPDVILHVEVPNCGTEIIYTLSGPILLYIDLLIQADRTLVYHNEVADITASLYRHVGPNLIQVADYSVVYAVSSIPPLHVLGEFTLLNPSLMSAGAETNDFLYRFMTQGIINQLHGIRFFNNGYTLDFSGVNITVGGVTRTYAEWLNEPNNPVVFQYADGSPLSANHQMTVTSPNILSWNSPIPFRAVTNENFTDGSVINFNGLRAYGDIRINNRGPNVNFAPPPGHFTTTISTSATHRIFTGIARDYNTTVTLAHLVTPTAIPYIIAYSESYRNNATHSHFYYQELFVSRISSIERDGSNVEITYSIPDGVTITHIRIPRSGTNDVTRYDNIILVKNGVPYSLGNSGGLLNFVTGTGPGGVTGLPAFTSGEDVVFRFENVQMLGAGATTIGNNFGLQFVGTTNSTVTAGTPLTFSAQTNETSGPTTSITTSATTNYWMSMASGTRSTLIGNSLNQPITSIELDVPFYFYGRMQTPTTPAVSVHRTNPANPAASSVFSSPVFYFSLPQGVVHSGWDAAEIVTATGAPATAHDLNGNIITPRITNVWNDAGFYAGGTLVEVKLENADRPDEVFWMTGTTWVRLQVFIDPEFDGTGIVIAPQSIALGSWDPMVVNVGQWGSNGVNMTIPAASGKIHSGTQGIISAQTPTQTLTVINPSAVRISASTMTPFGNLTYVPGVRASYAEVRAGNVNETFRLFISNELEDGIFPNGQVFFILPHQENWRPVLTAPARLTTAGINSNDFKIFYTFAPIDYSDIGDRDVYNLSSLRDFTWYEMTFTGTTASAAIDWANVTAVRVDMNLKGFERIELQLPFGVPRVDGNNVNYGDRARGQTLFFLNDNFFHDNVATAAIVLERSNPPVVAAVNPASPVPAAFSDVTIDYLTGTIPNWHEFYTFDDLTPDLKIRDVNVTFTPALPGPQTTHIISGSNIKNVKYMPQRPTGLGGYEDDVDFVYGFRWGIQNPTDFVKHGTPGVFRITYTTEMDDDSQYRVAVKNITMTKCPLTIGITAPDKTVLWNTNLGMSVESFFREFVTVTDTEPVVTSRILLIEETPAFNINQPGHYELKFEYTDIGNNKVSDAMIVSVLFNGTLTGSVLGNGMPVEGFTIDIDGEHETTGTTGGFSHELTATVTAPAVAYYNIMFVSPVPAGLKDTITLPISGSGTPATPATETINFEAVSMTINVAGPTSGVDSIRLYRVGSSSPVMVIDTITSSTVFAREAGQGWFVAGNYYFVAVLNPGYRVTSTSDFEVNSSILDVQTANFAIGNADLTRDLDIEIAPLISGTVWNDANRDSVMDSGESVITSATVTLFDATGTTPPRTTATNSSGIYNFVDLDETLSYIVEIRLPQGFNRASPLANDSRIDPVTFRTDPIDFVGGLHVTDIHAGFYAVSGGGGGGSGTGSATIRPSGSAYLGEDDPPYVPVPEEPEVAYEEPQEEPRSWWWLWLLLLLLLLLILYVAYRRYKAKKESELNA